MSDRYLDRPESFTRNAFGDADREAAELRSGQIVRHDVFVGDLAAGRAVIHQVPFTGSGSYSTGGDDVVLPPGLDLSAGSAAPVWVLSAGTFLLFVPVLSSGKVEVYDTSFAEVSAGTDLSGISTTLQVVEPLATQQRVYKAHEAMRLTGLELSVARDAAFDGTNYWTAQARVVRSADGDFEDVGNLFSGADRTLEASTRYELLDVGRANDVMLAPSDEITLDLTEFGVPNALMGLRLGILMKERR